MTRNYDYSVSARMRRFNAEHKHRAAESSRRGTYERCARCRERYSMGSLRKGLCDLCRVELIDEPDYERYEWEMRTGGSIRGSLIA